MVRERNEILADRIGLGFAVIKSSFRPFLNYAVLDAKSGKPLRDNWWHGFQHGIGLLGLAAPLAWVRRTDQVIISSSYAACDPFFTRCASDPSIDSSLRFFGVSCRHHDVTITPQQKVSFICGEAKALQRSVPLRVCRETQTGHNCCLCDKCLRTIFGVYAEDADPNDFGFPLTDEKLAAITAKLKSGGVTPTAFWSAIVEKLRAKDATTPSAPHVAALLDLFGPAREPA